MRVYQLARQLKISTKELLSLLSEWGIEGKTSLSGLAPEEIEEIQELVKEKPVKTVERRLPPRDPVVAVLGHVDHGKTTLLDTIRNTQIVREEVGGITQRIGASEIHFQENRIVFIDTPGHEAFTAMRRQGAQATDIVVLVVAADDGIMPQTEEAINHAQAAKVPIVVAINKIDKDNANPERVKRQLTRYELTPEEWGGETICVEVSALRGEGVEELLEMLLLQAEIMELSGDPQSELQAVVIESEIDRYKGPFSTLIVKQGTLRVGDVIVGGEVYGRVRALINWKGERVKEATLSTPVQVLGLSDVSTPGQVFSRVDSEKTARGMAEEVREENRRKNLRRKEKVTLESILGTPEEKEVKTLNLIIKADSQGSLKAVVDSLVNLGDDEVKVEIVSQGVGEVSKSDVLLASTSEAIILGFNVDASSDVQSIADQEQVEIRRYQVIYDVLDDIKRALQGMLAPVFEEDLIAKVEIRDTFRVPRVGTVAGCYVTEGRITRGAKAKIIRDGEVIGEGPVVSLKRFEKDVNTVSTGLECGVKVEGAEEVQKGDLLEVYQQRRVR